MKKTNTKKLVLGALFAALTCVCTMAITFPTPTGGYVHAGDCFVILSGIYLGPLAGGLAGGIGSMFSDVFLGYISYAPATFLIKFLAAFTVGLFYHATHKLFSSKTSQLLQVLLCGLFSGSIVIVGYFLYEWLLTFNVLTAALSGILGNTFQGIMSIVLSVLFYTFIPKNIMNQN